MIGKNERYHHLKMEEFEFPAVLESRKGLPKNEREFLEFLIRNDWVQRRIGIKMYPTNGFFPDIKGEIYDGTGDPIKVEVEYSASNYIMHGHPFGACDLVLSFIRRTGQKVIRGCPVWSFYEKCWDRLYYCLDQDVCFDFERYDSDGME